MINDLTEKILRAVELSQKCKREIAWGIYEKDMSSYCAPFTLDGLIQRLEEYCRPSPEPKHEDNIWIIPHG